LELRSAGSTTGSIAVQLIVSHGYITEKRLMLMENLTGCAYQTIQGYTLKAYSGIETYLTLEIKLVKTLS
jgi:hypothetical protein